MEQKFMRLMNCHNFLMENNKILERVIRKIMEKKVIKFKPFRNWARDKNFKEKMTIVDSEIKGIKNSKTISLQSTVKRVIMIEMKNLKEISFKKMIILENKVSKKKMIEIKALISCSWLICLLIWVNNKLEVSFKTKDYQ